MSSGERANRVTVLVVDDHPVVRAGLRALLAADFAIVGEASGGAEALVLARALSPRVVLMDFHMPGMGGVYATRLVTRALPEVRVVVLVTLEPPCEVARALRAGAVGWIAKDAPRAELVLAVRRAAT